MFVRLCLDDCKNRLNRLCGFISQFFFLCKAQDVSKV